MIKEFGICFNGTIPVSEIIEYSQLAEKKGIGTVWFAEDYFVRSGMATITAIAMATKKIKVGLGVVNPYTRNPVLTAMESATIDELSGGRLILGIGPSNPRWLERGMNIKFEKPLTAVRDCVAIVRELLSTQKCTYKGHYFSLGPSGVTFGSLAGIQRFKPIRSRIPIYLGVTGPKMLELAGEIADGVILSLLTTPDYTKMMIESIRKGADRAGRDMSEIDICAYYPMSVSEDSHAAREYVRPALALLLCVMNTTVTAGMTEEARRPFLEAYQSALAKGQVPNVPSTVQYVTDALMEKFAVAGTPEECCMKLEKYVAAGVKTPIAYQTLGPDPLRAIELIGDTIIPHFM